MEHGGETPSLAWVNPGQLPWALSLYGARRLPRDKLLREVGEQPGVK